MISTVLSGGLYGVEAYLVQVEADISTGLPGFEMVGFLKSEVKEARERVQVALRNAGYDLPPMKITVNLAPANVKKEGTAYDLPIAVGVMASLGYFDRRALEGILFLGELGLDGELRPVRGVLPIVSKAAENGVKCCIVPKKNGREGAAVSSAKIRGAENICQVIRYLQSFPTMQEGLLPCIDPEKTREDGTEKTEDFDQVCGQEGAVRAAQIAAAGFHNLLMIGPPGAGKSMIAKRIPGILPPLTDKESMEVSGIYSVAGLLKENRPLVTDRPFWDPHHTVTKAALTGGGCVPRPGIMSLAHKGVLFLDELPEFARPVIDCLRQPLEEHEVHIARTWGDIVYPADFMLVCAMNPCPCGYFPDRNRCRCKESEIRRYLGRVSGPILDRMDLCVEIRPVGIASLKGRGREKSSDLRARVLQARKIQKERYAETPISFNSQIPSAEIEKYCPLGERQQKIMEEAYEAMGLSARGYHRILRTARTIADLDGGKDILEEHLLEAIGYRTGNAVERKWEE